MTSKAIISDEQWLALVKLEKSIRLYHGRGDIFESA